MMSLTRSRSSPRPSCGPRDAASLILLRGEGKDLEVLAGRRPLHVRFMPGVHVFPGGAIDPPDRLAWSLELGDRNAGAQARALRPGGAARDLGRSRGVGRPPGWIAFAGARDVGLIERAYNESGLVAAMDLLTYVGRAITPSHSNRRFNTRFFLCEGDNVFGEPASSDELEDVALVSDRATSARIIPRCDAFHACASDRVCATATRR